VKRETLALIELTQERTGWKLDRILRSLGITKSRYHAWRRRRVEDKLGDRCSRPITDLDALRSEEKEAVKQYALAHPKDGYRRLAWQMVDEDVAFLSASSVYRVLSEADLLYRWKRSTHSGAVPIKPTQPNERWHTDIMYLRVQDTWYFLVTVLDSYSRYVVHWNLLSSMAAWDVSLVVQEALELTRQNYPGASEVKPDVVTDNGAQFTSKDFKQLIRHFELEHIRIRTYHPESNGVLERFHRTTREEIAEEDLVNLARAREIIARWVKHYNEERLHAGLDYLQPVEYYRGDPEARRNERKAKLTRARDERKRINQERLEERLNTPQLAA
jgi:transposase InsO family protein